MNDQGNNQNDFAPGSLLRRIPLALFDAAVVKVAIMIFLLVGGGWGFLNWGRNAKPKEDPTKIVNGNLGFKIDSNMLGFGGELKTFESPTEAEPPYSVLIKGEHRVRFVVQPTLSKGGILGIGKTQSHWVVEGNLLGDFSKDSLYSLLENEPEKLFVASILPVIREGVESELEAIVADTEKTPSVEKLTELAAGKVIERLKNEFDITNATLEFSNLHQMTDAEKKRDHVTAIERAECTTILKTIERQEEEIGLFGWLIGLAALPVMILAGLFFLVILGSFLRAFLG